MLVPGVEGVVGGVELFDAQADEVEFFVGFDGGGGGVIDGDGGGGDFGGEFNGRVGDEFFAVVREGDAEVVFIGAGGEPDILEVGFCGIN